MTRGAATGRRRPIGAARLVRAAAVALAVAANAVFHIWSRTRVVAAGYRLGALQAEHTKLVSEQDRLRIEVETLRAPRALEEFARKRLGMAPPDSGPVWAAGPRTAPAAAGGAGVDGVGHHPGPAEPSLPGRAGRAAAGVADPGTRVAFRGPLRAGRAPRPE